MDAMERGGLPAALLGLMVLVACEADTSFLEGDGRADTGPVTAFDTGVDAGIDASIAQDAQPVTGPEGQTTQRLADGETQMIDFAPALDAVMVMRQSGLLVINLADGSVQRLPRPRLWAAFGDSSTRLITFGGL